MDLNLHHFFILVEPGGAQGEQLLDLGFLEEKPGTHPGQGTSNRRFYLADGMMLELLWVHDAKESSTGPARMLHFSDRVKNSQASPFGLIFCPVESREQGSKVNPFPGWSYQPDYFHPPMAFHVGDNSDKLNEPLCIFAPFFNPVTSISQSEEFAFIREIRITLPQKQFSSILKTVSEVTHLTRPGFKIKTGDDHLMELFFESANNNKTDEVRIKDFRPDLPLIIYGWQKNRQVLLLEDESLDELYR